eukprot:TRINITY_DN77473_c0_g1_i1.p2 TRINITY_DN77473_c0_g1~~TRINITY_DN77473_c0_g1_i1.p2  ORF type:complete len:256 (-),score=55.54 TRINITY_DN77473_c0_g1_i1:85-852(-)
MAASRGRGWRPLALAGLLACLAWTSTCLSWLAIRGRPTARQRTVVPVISLRPALRGSWDSRVALLAGAADTFDPWTVLGISTDASPEEARKAYKKLIAKYHPDVDPSPEAEAKFQRIVRAHAVVTGEDKILDQTTLLNNAVENLRSDMESTRAKVERLKAEAAAAERDMETMEAQLESAESQRDKISNELGGFGGGALGLLAGGLPGALIGAIVGMTLGRRDDAIGKIIRGSGTIAKGVADSVVSTVSSAANSKS